MPQHTDSGSTDAVTLADLLHPAAVELASTAKDVEAAVRQAGALLVETGAVEAGYVSAMLEREASVSTFVGDGLAFPHATFASRGEVERDALSLVRFSEPVDWNGERVTVAIGLAARGRGHIALLSRLASALLEPGRADELRSAPDLAAVAHALREND